MNKQELIAKIAKDTGATKVGAAAALDSVLDGITKSLKKGEPITFVGFGTFKTCERKARTARNPQTGAASQDPEAPRRPLLGRQGPEDGGQVASERAGHRRPAAGRAAGFRLGAPSAAPPRHPRGSDAR